ncbi:M48 family peptidase, partial [Burkholderia multivorans]|nr:M48 family peptidase [Burkholderia multivorans]
MRNDRLRALARLVASLSVGAAALGVPAAQASDTAGNATGNATGAAPSAAPAPAAATPAPPSAADATQPS